MKGISDPKISIIIPVLNSPLINQTLYSLQQQKFELDDRVEVIIVGLLDCEPSIKPGIKMQFIEANVSVGEARNLGIKASSGEWLVFLDSDCICSEEWLSRLAGRLLEGWPVVGGGVSICGGSFYATCYNIATFHEFLDTLPPGQRSYLPTLNLAMWREVAENVGPIDRELPRSEDIEWTVRIKKKGYPLYFEPRATVFHRPQTSLRRVLIKWFNTGYCSRIVRQQHPGQLEIHRVLNSPTALVCLSPLIGAIAALRIFWRHPNLLKYFYTLPVIFLTRLVWCWGAAASFRYSLLGRAFPYDKRHLVT